MLSKLELEETVNSFQLDAVDDYDGEGGAAGIHHYKNNMLFNQDEKFTLNRQMQQCNSQIDIEAFKEKIKFIIGG